MNTVYSGLIAWTTDGSLVSEWPSNMTLSVNANSTWPCDAPKYNATLVNTEVKSNQSNYEEVTSETGQFEFVGLQPFSSYTAYSIAYITFDNQTAFVNLNLTNVTAAGTPGPVWNVIANTVDSSTVMVTWMQPNQTNGIIVDYFVMWYDSTNQNVGNQSLGSNQTSLLIGNLLPCSEYSGRIQAQSNADLAIAFGNWTYFEMETSFIESTSL